MNPLLTRRTFFRGATLGAGSILLAPFVNRLAAGEAPSPPLRFVFVMEGNGFNPMQAQPVTIPRIEEGHRRTDNDVMENLSLAGHELSEATAPLHPWQDRIAILQGLSGRVCGGGHSNNFGALGCYSSKSGPAGETIDLALARAVPSIFPQIGLGISSKSEHTIIYNTSARAAEQPSAYPVPSGPGL